MVLDRVCEAYNDLIIFEVMTDGRTNIVQFHLWTRPIWYDGPNENPKSWKKTLPSASIWMNAGIILWLLLILPFAGFFKKMHQAVVSIWEKFMEPLRRFTAWMDKRRSLQTCWRMSPWGWAEYRALGRNGRRYSHLIKSKTFVGPCQIKLPRWCNQL